MTSELQFTSEQRLDGDVLEREFTLGEIRGIVWTPASAPAPLILLGHPGALRRMYPRVVARALHSAADGFATVSIELPQPVGEEKTRAEQARADLMKALESGGPVDEEIIERLINRQMLDRAVTHWRGAMDAALALPEIAGPVGLSGGAIALGIRLVTAEPRIVAARLFAGTYVPRAMFAEAGQVNIPLQVMLQWDDEGNDRQSSLELFDAFGSKEKALHANMGGHTGIPASEAEEGSRFFARHLK
ncbi:alpha/beta hydrolase [Nocardia sp. NEAU-351]|uniref:Alpha/beta hydrolase n=1 Tax=Nocardia bovistercoris TaxID=2785916 RepID=A0A931N6I7_9NOCA|nr:alpha/beta hydrolase [Nocardia bovistercoris]